MMMILIALQIIVNISDEREGLTFQYGFMKFIFILNVSSLLYIFL